MVDAQDPVKVGKTGFHKPSFSIELVTPEKAQDLILRRRREARPQPAAVRVYSQSMTENRWVFNGMPIIFSSTGVLLDGVQRLAASVESGRAFLTVLAQNIDDATLHTIDQQRRRSYAGVLESRGERHSHALMSTLAKLIRYDEGASTSHVSIPWGRFDRVLEANPDIRDAVHAGLQYPSRIIGDAVRLPLFFMGLRTKPEALTRFLDAVESYEEQPPEEPGAVIRTRIEMERGRLEKTKPAELLAICIKALSDQITGERHRFYRWQPDTGEEYPRLAGYTGLNEPAPPAIDLAGNTRLGDDVPHLASQYTMSLETITPEIAARYLTHNARNRRIIPSHVETIARDIRTNNWMMNAQPICFARSGRLLNGQHRLSACIAAGMPIEVLVLQGLAEEAYDTFDVHAKRPAPLNDDTSASVMDENTVRAAAKLLWQTEHPELGSVSKPSSTEIQAILRKHPGLAEKRHFGRRTTFLARASIMAFVAYKVTRDEPRMGAWFLERLEHGDELNSKSVILSLRNKLIRYRKSPKHVDRQAVLELILDTWEKFRHRPDKPFSVV